jgi:hypothetical protein
MLFINKNASALLALPALLVSAFALGGTGCSSSSPAGAPASDASTSEGGPPSPLGVPVATCAGCAVVCGGVLASATTGFTFCTQDCATNADCPTGTGCAADVLTSQLPAGQQLPNECLKTCTTDADCSGGFVCRSDIATAGSFCWSPFPPPVDAGSGAPEAGPDAAAEAGTSEAGTSEAGGPDASGPDASGPDASAGDASDAASE